MSDAKNRLLSVLPHVRLAIEMARVENPNGMIELAIVSKNVDGSGTITASFGGEFLDDVASVLDVKDKPGWMCDDEDTDP